MWTSGLKQASQWAVHRGSSSTKRHGHQVGRPQAFLLCLQLSLPPRFPPHPSLHQGTKAPAVKFGSTLVCKGPQVAEKKTSWLVSMLRGPLTLRRLHLCTVGFHGLRTFAPSALGVPSVVDLDSLTTNANCVCKDVQRHLTRDQFRSLKGEHCLKLVNHKLCKNQHFVEQVNLWLASCNWSG